ncbi:MAG: hypothetical protein AAF614_12260 [Chloroflexota bacterium]
MDALLDAIGLTGAELTQILVVIAVLVVALIVLRTMFRLTAALFRAGCFVVVLVGIALLMLYLFN